ncbi:MAG TPA: hypothetical protein VNG71_21710, partial [Pyrinomonadaceae bacterium]|nr:hypothetical protein [Pyrinomonadaceae bacterium]
MKTRVQRLRIGVVVFFLLISILAQGTGQFRRRAVQAALSVPIPNFGIRNDGPKRLDSAKGKKLPLEPKASSKLSCVTGILAGQEDCVLTGDMSIAKPLTFTAKRTLDCQLHHLTASVPATANAASQPQVAILAKDMSGVVIKNCFIEGFDFGIYAINSKGPHQAIAATESPAKGPSAPELISQAFSFPNSFVHNDISARLAGISLTQVDNTQIINNMIRFPSSGGRGIVVQLDSDGNTVKDNTLVADTMMTVSTPLRAPGPRLASNAPLATGAGYPAGGAIVVEQVGGSEPLLLTAVVEGELFQVQSTSNATPNQDFTEDNLIYHNQITFPAAFPLATDGILLAVPQRTVVQVNTITQPSFGMRVGSQAGSNTIPVTKQVAQKCSNSSRLCLDNTECFIPGVDTASLGTCGAATNQPVSWMSSDTLIQGNTIIGPFIGGILIAGRNTNVQGNTINGPVLQPMNTPPPAIIRAGIGLLGKFALESTVITQNTVSGASPVLSLQKTFSDLSPQCVVTATCVNAATCAGMQISLNDFLNYSRSVLLDAGNDQYFDLSFQGRGNYWQ